MFMQYFGKLNNNWSKEMSQNHQNNIHRALIRQLTQFHVYILNRSNTFAVFPDTLTKYGQLLCITKMFIFSRQP